VSRGTHGATAGRVLVVEDDEGIREMLKYNLVTAGFSVQEASDGATGLRTARTSRPDLILLDLMLPGMSGFDFCRALRKSSRVPIIMITAKDAEVDKIVGLELGADDYITKPFSVREVLARVNAVLRRAQPEANEPKAIPEHDSIGTFSIDRAARRVMLDGNEIRLTAREFDLLSYLLAVPGRVHTREVLLENVWGREFNGEPKTVDVHIRWLREKFQGHAPFDIVTVRGIGYRLDRLVFAVEDALAKNQHSTPPGTKEGHVGGRTR
jgi:DNA-binding response OmpR family regulator